MALCLSRPTTGKWTIAYTHQRSVSDSWPKIVLQKATSSTRPRMVTVAVTILSHFELLIRPPGSDTSITITSQALQALDDGVGFLYEEVEDMLSYGTPESLSTHKKYGGLHAYAHLRQQAGLPHSLSAALTDLDLIKWITACRQ